MEFTFEKANFMYHVSTCANSNPRAKNSQLLENIPLTKHIIFLWKSPVAHENVGFTWGSKFHGTFMDHVTFPIGKKMQLPYEHVKM